MLARYCLMLAHSRLLFTNLEAQLCSLHLPGLNDLLLVFFITLLFLEFINIYCSHQKSRPEAFAGS